MGDRLRRRPAVLWRRIGSGVVLLVPDQPDPVDLGGAAALLWDLLEERTSISEATQFLSRACGIDEADVERELAGVIDDLAAIGAVEQVSTSGC